MVANEPCLSVLLKANNNLLDFSLESSFGSSANRFLAAELEILVLDLDLVVWIGKTNEGQLLKCSL